MKTFHWGYKNQSQSQLAISHPEEAPDVALRAGKTKHLRKPEMKRRGRHHRNAVFTSSSYINAPPGNRPAEEGSQGSRHNQTHSCTGFCFSSSSLPPFWISHGRHWMVDVWIILAVNIFLHLKWWSEKTINRQVTACEREKRGEQEREHSLHKPKWEVKCANVLTSSYELHAGRHTVSPRAIFNCSRCITVKPVTAPLTGGGGGPCMCPPPLPALTAWQSY